VIDALSIGQVEPSVAGRSLLPQKQSLTVGIQGGKGSFNEEAALKHIPRLGIGPFQITYLHTTENVLSALDQGSIDVGQFAIYNTLGGDVEESIEALRRYRVEIITRYSIKISHALMISPTADLAEVDTIVTHPQVLRQCKTTLQSRYGHLKLTTCHGELIDPARVAELIGLEQLPNNVATISNKMLSELHGLKIVDVDLQDAEENYTTFLLVRRSD
jgi:prephenate dehydratase